MIFWIAPAFKIAPYILGGLDYLRRLVQPLVSNPAPVSSGYVPPFTGGQTKGVTYKVFPILYFADGFIYQPDVFIQVDGAIIDARALPYSLGGGFVGVDLIAQGATVFAQARVNSGGNIIVGGAVRIVRADGQAENAVPPPNPNPPSAISDDGIADSAPPNLDGAPTVIEAIPPIIIPSFAAAFAAALAAARNALDALDAIKAVARALEALSDLLNKKNAEENKKEKEKKESQDTIRYDFGSIEKDGFLRLYPQSNLGKYVAQQLDISFVVIPTYLGKYFGKFSPNYYRYKPTSNLISSLGYISFVSPTFGILSTHHLEFRRSSIKVPENSIGFYYHLGLDGALIANAFAFYTKPKI